MTHRGVPCLLFLTVEAWAAIGPVITEINDLCKTPGCYRWADKMVRLGLAFWHISLDGLEIAAAALSSTKE